MKTYILERFKHIWIWLICGAVLGYLVHYLRTRQLTLTTDNLFFLKMTLIGFVAAEVLNLIRWLFNRIKQNNL